MGYPSFTMERFPAAGWKIVFTVKREKARREHAQRENATRQRVLVVNTSAGSRRVFPLGWQ